MFIRQNDTGKIGIGPFVDKTDGITMETAASLSSADSARVRLGDDTTVDISGFTFAAIANMDGYYDLTLTTGITDTVGIFDILIEDVSVFVPVAMRFYVIEEEVYDALYAASAKGFQGTPTISAPSNTTAPPLAPTLEEAIIYLYTRIVRNKTTIDSTEEIVFADDGSTELYTRAITDSGGTVTYAEAAAGT